MLTETQLNQLYTDLGCDAVWPLRGNAAEVLGIYGNADGTTGAGIAYTTAGPESCRSGNVATFSGSANSYANLGSLAGLMSRIASGGGFVVHFFFKIASGVTNWQIGTNVPTTGPSLYYVRGGSNNQFVFIRNSQTSGYIDTEVTFGDTLRDDTWHALGFVYNHVTGVIRSYIDGELWSEGSILSARGTAGDALTTNIANFMLGGYSFNGGGTSAADPFASAFAEVSVASKVFSDEEMRKLYELGVATFKPASWLPLRNGPRARTVATRVFSDIREFNPLVIVLGDSMMTLNGFGGLADPYIRRRINQMSGGRLANWEPIRIGDASDSNAPPGKLVAITAGSTQKYLVGLRTQDLYNNDYTLGSDVYNRKTYALDASQGVKILIGFRKEGVAGRGPITYVVRGADMRNPNSPTALDGSENYQAIIDSGTAFTASELIGDGRTTAYKYLSIPAAARYKYLQVELTNGGSTTANLVDLDFVSRANSRGGPWVKIAARGGYRINTFYDNHPRWTQMYKDLRTFLGDPPVHVLVMLGANDGANLSPSTWYTSYAAFAAQLFADIPDATLSFATTPPISGSYTNGIRLNARAANFTGAALEYAELNNALNINNINSRNECVRHYGWTPWTQSTARYTVVGEYDAATTYAQGELAYFRLNTDDTLRKYYYSRFSQTGEPVFNQDKWTEVCRFVNVHPDDLLHQLELGQMVNVDCALSGFALPEPPATRRIPA